MNRYRDLTTLFILLTLALAGGWYGFNHYQKQQRSTFELAGSGASVLPRFAFPDLEGKLRSSDEWQEQRLVVNFWATWCPPCREEMPRFIDAQKRYGERVQFIAIAIDEPEMVQDFVDVYAINFPVLIAGPEAIQLASSLGNRFNTLPFTVIIDREGRIRYRQAGEMSEATLEQQLRTVLE